MEGINTTFSSSSSTKRSLSTSFSFSNHTNNTKIIGGRRRSLTNHHSPHNFLESCKFCNKQLNHGHDIYMYKGDTPFCSEDCRQEQIDIDEAKEKNKLKFSKLKAKENNKSASKSSKIQARAVTAAVAC